MSANYLRVKKWKDWQHYKDREPPWVKLHAKLLRDDLFCELTEGEQWQLVRIWMIASQSSRFTVDEKRRLVPVISDDEQALRRTIQSLKKVPIAKFVREGWLIPVNESDLVDPAAFDSTAIAPGNHGDSTGLDPGKPESSTGDSTLLEVEGRGLERSSSNGSRVLHSVAPKSLPFQHEHLLEKLMGLCASSADSGTEGVLKSYAKRLPEASLAKVIESTERQPPDVRARYANGALQSEIAELGEVA